MIKWNYYYYCKQQAQSKAQEYTVYAVNMLVCIITLHFKIDFYIIWTYFISKFWFQKSFWIF